MEKRISTIASYAFIISAFIIPLAISFSPLVSFQFAKVIPFFLVTFLVAFLFIIRIFNQGKIAIPSNWLSWSVLLVPASYILSSFFSVHASTSFIGTGVEIDTASMITGLFLFMFLIAYFVRAKERAFNAYLAFMVAFVFLSIFHVLRFVFGADFLSFGVFTAVVSNTVGRFTDLGIVSGIAVLISLTSIEFLRVSKLVRTLSYVLLSVSLVMLAITNFPILVWGPNSGDSITLFTLVGFFAFTFFVYFVSSSYGTWRQTAERYVPMASLIVLVVSVIFTFGATPLGSLISSAFKIESMTETRLLWNPTTDLSVSTIKDFPVRSFLGYGPNQFAYKWLRDKPVEINGTILWNGALSFGSGFIPSSLVTTGIIGFLSWILFLIFIGRYGVPALFAKDKDSFSHYITVSSFLVSVYLWIAAIVYVPSIVTFFFTFFFTGLFLASLFREKILKEKEYVFDNSKGKSFVSIMTLIVLLLIMLFWAYKIGEQVAASVYASRANSVLASAQSNDDIEKAKVYLRNAAVLANRDSYARVLGVLTLAQVNSIVADKTTPSDQLSKRFQTLYPEAVNYAQSATTLNPNSFDNYVSYGNVLEVGASLHLNGYYDGAKAAYEAAGRLDPKSPLIPYLLAQLEADNQNLEGAKTHIGEALQLKANYLQAIVLLGRIQITEGKNQDALASFMVAQSLDPSNQDIAAVLNLLRNGGTVSQPSTTTTSTSTSATSTSKQ